MKTVVQYLRKVALLQGGDSPTDGQLLETFLTRRDEAAFEALLRRHGPMVLGVCRRVLHNPHDAEDAFQATFLVLVRKASSVRSRERVGPWLYGVAQRTALKARALSAKRHRQERAARSGRRVEAAADRAWDELLEHLDAEVSRLPDRYRLPVLLCELQGKSRKEAAQFLGLPEGTLSSRLAQARKLLAQRLSKYGATLPGGALAAALAGDAEATAVPLALLTSTTRAAVQLAAGRGLTAGAVSASVVALTEGVVKAMLLSKFKTVWVVALVASLGAGAAGLTYRAVAAEPGQAGGGTAAVRDELEELRLEIEALRKGLHATRERVKALESEVQALKRPSGGGGSSSGSSSTMPGMSGGGAGSSYTIPGMPGGMGMGMGGPGMPGGGMGSGTPAIGGGSRDGGTGGSGMSRMAGEMMGGPPQAKEPTQRPAGAKGSNKPPTITALNPGQLLADYDENGRLRLYLMDESGWPRLLKVAGAAPQPAHDLLAHVEAALKILREEHPEDKQAAEALEQVLQRLKKQAKPAADAGKPRAKDSPRTP